MPKIFQSIVDWFKVSFMPWLNTHKVFDNNWGTVAAIIVFVLLFLFLLAKPARSEEMYFDAGSAIARGETPAIGMTIAWKDVGPVHTDYELGFNLIGQSVYREKDVSNQIVLHASIVDGYKNFEMGLGFAYANVPSPFTCQETFSLLARWRFTQRFHVQYHHFSSAGSCRPNIGRDLVTVGYRF